MLDYHTIIRSRCEELGLDYQHKADIVGLAYRYTFWRRLTLVEQNTLSDYEIRFTNDGERICETWPIKIYLATEEEHWYAAAVYHEGGLGPGDFVKSFDSFEAVFACIVEHQMNWQGPPFRLKK